jgi:putative transposase
MPRKGYQAEEIIAKPREADVLLGDGKEAAEIVKALEVSKITYYRRRQEYGGMSVWSDPLRLDRSGSGDRA